MSRDLVAHPLAGSHPHAFVKGKSMPESREQMARDQAADAGAPDGLQTDDQVQEAVEQGIAVAEAAAHQGQER